MKNVEKFGSSTQATDENIIRRRKVRYSWLITRTRIQTHTYSTQWAYSSYLHGKNDYAKAPKYFFMRTFLVFFILRKIPMPRISMFHRAFFNSIIDKHQIF